MPNLSFDIFFDNDVFNFTAARSQGIPKVKPGWKVRTAPKLPPKEKPQIDGAQKAIRPPTKPVAKPSVQPKSAPAVVKKPIPTIKAPASGKVPQANTNGVKA